MPTFPFLQPVDKQSLLDSGILCCLIHILNALLSPDQANQKQKPSDYERKLQTESNYVDDVVQARRLEVDFFFWCLSCDYFYAYIIYIRLAVTFGSLLSYM